MTIEQRIIECINGTIDDVPAYGMIPEGAEAPFFVVERTGGTETNHISSAMVAIQSYGTTIEAAMLLNESLKERMLETFILRGDVASCRLNSDYNFTNTTTRKPRYQAVFDIVYY